ncbi:MAG: hypothetical protein CVU64_07985 [Deltaproteobacteria bacterium HGW-Deltaproteobacteria-21]|nr:MAG: hypothetical protein CVU64_07985 [Deltaproteobacteria bacterium HGW-Deltaproteobacteria-21]
MKTVRVVLLILCGILAAVSPCFSQVSPDGNYIVADFNVSETDFHPYASLGLVAFSDGGSGTHQELFTSGTDPLETSPFTYSASPDGSLTVNSETAMHGILSANGTAFALSTTEGGYPGIGVALKKSSGMTNATMAGTYLAADFSASKSSHQSYADLGLVSVNGTGGGTHQMLYTSSGSPSTSSFTYSVSADGSLTVNSETAMHGILSADGSLFVLSTTAGSSAGITVGVKKSSGMSNANMKGDYIIAVLTSSKTSYEPFSDLDLVKVNGSGSGTFSALYNSSPGGAGSGTFTYSVGPDGSLAVNGETVEHGIISADGSVFVLSNTEGAYAGITVGIKKAFSTRAMPWLLLLLDD